MRLDGTRAIARRCLHCPLDPARRRVYALQMQSNGPAKMQRKAFFQLAVALFLSGLSFHASAVWVRLMALGPNRAELRINQTPLRVMYAGETSPEGVRLVAVTRDFAQIEANGFSYRLTLGQRIEPMVVLEADRGGHYATELVVNGQRIAALVDTGATTVALNRTVAERLGLDYRRGRLIKMSTANGVAEAYLITLNEVQMGPIVLRGIDATVSALPHSPPVTLLGMSFLRRLELVTDGRQLKLMQLR